MAPVHQRRRGFSWSSEVRRTTTDAADLLGARRLTCVRSAAVAQDRFGITHSQDAKKRFNARLRREPIEFRSVYFDNLALRDLQLFRKGLNRSSIVLKTGNGFGHVNPSRALPQRFWRKLEQRVEDIASLHSITIEFPISLRNWCELDD